MIKASRIALIHATPIAIDPIREAFESLWHEAETINIVDDSLTQDRAKALMVSDQLVDRIAKLTLYAVSTGADAVLFTCSAFGAAIEEAGKAVDVPVLRPNEAMFEAAIAHGGKTAMLYSFGPAKVSMEEEFREEARRLGSNAEISSVFVPGAMEAVRAGDVITHNRLIAEAAALLSDYEAVTLAQFSMARALRETQAATPITVLSSPEQAVVKLKRLLSERDR